MAEEKIKKPFKVKPSSIIKVIGICLGAVFGLIGISLGFVAITGGFNPPYHPLEGLKFEQNVYVIDGNLEKVLKQDSGVFHIDYQTKVDEENNPIYETIKALPTNKNSTELDATLTIINGKNIQLVEDENTKIFNKTEETDETAWQRKYSIKLNSNIKIVPVKQKINFLDQAGIQVERDVNVGGWALLQIEQGLHIAYCYVYVDVPVYGYEIDALEKEGVEKYQAKEGDNPLLVPDYLVNNIENNGDKFTFKIDKKSMAPLDCFETVYNVDPTRDNHNISLNFNLQEEIKNLYPQKVKQIIFKSSKEDVAKVIQNADNTATIELQPNHYGETFEITSYVVSIYKDAYHLPDLEDFKKKYGEEAEEKYNEALAKLRIESSTTIKFQIKNIDIETFEVSQTALDYKVFDNSVINLTRDGSSQNNSKNSEQSLFNFTIKLNQSFADENSKLDEILNNIEVYAVYKNGDEYVEYGDDGAISLEKNSINANVLKINRKEDAKHSYLKFVYRVYNDLEELIGEYVTYAPITISLEETTLSLNKSELNVSYFKKPVIEVDSYGDSVNNNTNLDVELNPILSNQNATYKKLMYFINSKENLEENFVQFDEDVKLVPKNSNETYFALRYVQMNDDLIEEVLNNILRVTKSGTNAKLLVAIVKTSQKDGQGDVLLDENNNVDYYALATEINGQINFVSVSAIQQFEIDSAILEFGDIEKDLYNDIKNPNISLSKAQQNLNNAVFTMKYYGPRYDSGNFYLSVNNKVENCLTYAVSSEKFEGDVDDDGNVRQYSEYVVTFTANTNGVAVVSINANSNPSWSKTITIQVTDDVISDVVLSSDEDDDGDNIIVATYNPNSQGIEFNDIEFDVTITPQESNSSTTFARAIELNDEMIAYIANMLSLDINTITTREIVEKLNRDENARKELNSAMSIDSNSVDISSYKSLDSTLSVSIKGIGESLVLIYAMTNDEVTIASEVFAIKVNPFDLSSPTFEQEQKIDTLGNLGGYLARSENFNNGITASTTAISYNLRDEQFTLNGNAIQFDTLKFVFKNDTQNSEIGSTIENGIITFGAVPEEMFEIVYAYIGESLTSNFCKFEMKFKLYTDYLVSSQYSYTTKIVDKGQFVDLFELENGIPKLVITNKQGNMLFLPDGYDMTKIEQFDQDFLNQFKYSDAGGEEYYHIYLTIGYDFDNENMTVQNGLVKFENSGRLRLLSNASYVGHKIDIVVFDNDD